MAQQALPQEALACSQCGRTFAQSDVVLIAGKWVCGECKPAFLSHVMAGGAADPSGWHYGGFWMRFGARVIDSIVFAVPVLIFAAVFIPNLLRVGSQQPNPQQVNGELAAFGLTFIALFVVVAIFYEVLMLRYWGGTVGKLACGLIVVRSDGRSLGWGVSFGRFFMWNVVTNGLPYLNMLLMLISGIMAGTDEQKRALHDRVCDTRVVYKRSLASA
jgi:uncharacterized RDD family membrane protein YckC